ncbi:MAG: heat-inducible transcriptional repressor HrcA [Rhodospirillales bacterium]|nr:heat-inducible transcriptional repressor HrcA [Rhodospirillales bacterium]
MSRTPIVPFERKTAQPAAGVAATSAQAQSAVAAMDERSREVFRRIVEAYVETGEPVGSRTLSRQLPDPISPATIRNVMADLQDLGLLYSPHTSAGRLPTDLGLRLFVDGLLEVGRLSSEEREKIEAQCAAGGRATGQVLEQASTLLAGLGRGAGLVIAPKSDAPLKHVEFVPLGPGRTLVVLVTERGLVENRVIETPLGLTPQQLVQASNFLSAHLTGRTLVEARQDVLRRLEQSRAELDQLSQKVVEQGLAVWSTPEKSAGTEGYLIVRGQAKLLEDVHAMEDLERIRRLFEALEQHQSMARILEQAQGAEGVQIFIGAQNELFGLSGCTTIVAPYRDAQDKIVGAIGVVGPTRLNYARIIPMVDYTARVVGRLLG